MSCRTCKVSNLTRRGMQAFNDGNMFEAETLLNLSISQAAELNAILEAKARNNLALVLASTGRIEEAKSQVEIALSRVRERAGENNPLFRRIADHQQRLAA